MPTNTYLLIAPFTIGLAAITALIDLKKRQVPSANVKQLFGALILFPPLLGTIIYYFIVVRPNKYAASAVSHN